MKARDNCPGCGSRQLGKAQRLPRQPVVLNYRFASAAAARRVKRRDLLLTQCGWCGLVFNAVFDPGVIPYDENYENRQCFSVAFQTHLETVARRLIARHHLRGSRILEVGCGKGDFLRLICRLAWARGVGYDTTYEPATAPIGAEAVFHREYVSAADIDDPFDAVVCRHVVEHVPEIGSFLRELHSIAAACGDPVVVLETPRFEWIVRHRCLWDVFYEHCNYFPMPTLAYLCRQAGFRIVAQRSVFGGQYQLVELRLSGRPRLASSSPPGIPVSVRLDRFIREARGHLAELERRMTRAGGTQGWAIWGAGAKGVALVHLFSRTRPRFVIDSNAAKQGGVIPGSAIPILSPDDPRLQEVGLVLIANPNYLPEITSTLRGRGFSHTILSL